MCTCCRTASAVALGDTYAFRQPILPSSLNLLSMAHYVSNASFAMLCTALFTRFLSLNWKEQYAAVIVSGQEASNKVMTQLTYIQASSKPKITWQTIEGLVI